MKSNLRNTILKTGKLSIAFSLAIMILLGTMGMLAVALELPPTATVAYIQTSGPNTDLTIGDWYSFAGQGNRPHQFIINIPCTADPTQIFTMELFDPESYLSATPQAIDEIRNTPTNVTGNNADADVVTFTLFAPNDPVTPLVTQAFPPSAATDDQWVLFSTFDINTNGCGEYTLLAETGDDDDNAWRLRVTPDDTDGTPGTGDEIAMATFESSFQHSILGCQIFYFFVPVTPSIRLNNFDMDANWDGAASVTYTLPDGTNIGGTESTGTVWNNGDASNRGGDVFNNPQTGWWQAEICVIDDNQYIFEPEGHPYFFTLPPIPAMEIAKDDGRTIVSPDEILTYTLLFTNTSDPTNGGGAALNVVLTDQLPTNTTYVLGSCTINTHGGNCSESGGIITFNITDAVIANSSGSAQFSVRVNSTATGTVFNSVTLDYQDGLGNQFPPETATDTDTVVPVSQVDLEINKTDGGISTIPGGTVVYTLTYANLSLTTNATGVVITETVPDNTTYNATAAPGWTCIPDNSASSTCNWPTIATLAPNTGGSINFAVDVDASFSGNIITNTATIGGNEPDPNPDNNRSTDTTPVIQPGQVDLEINKTDGGVTTIPGGTVVYTLTYANLSLTTNATGVVITETVPDNTTYNATAAPGWTCIPDNSAGSTCNWPTIATLAPNTGGSINFAVDVNDLASLPAGVTAITNTVTIGGNEPDPNPGNNSSTDTTPIIYLDPIITKQARPDEVQIGDEVFFSITVSNPSSNSVVSATNVVIVDEIPLELDLITYSVSPPALVSSVSVSTNTVDTSGHPSGVNQTVASTITVNIPVLDVGDTVTLFVTSQVNDLASPPPVDIVNVAILSYGGGGPGGPTGITQTTATTASVSIPLPGTSPGPSPGPGPGGDKDNGGGGGDDDSAPAAAAAPPAEPVTLPVLFLPETGIGHTEGNDWFALPLLGIMMALYLWRITKKS